MSGTIANIRAVVAVATAVLGYDLLKDEINAIQPMPRVLKELAFCGSAAAADAIIEVMVNQVSIGKFENSSTGLAIDNQKDIKKLDVFVPANARIQAFVRDAPGTNDVVLYMTFAAPARASGGRRSFSRRSYTRRPTSVRRPSGGRTPGMY